MMLLTKALLVIKMLTAASVAPVAYEPCAEAPGAQECGSGLLCDGGLCLPTQDCETPQDCPAAPEGYSTVCERMPTCDNGYSEIGSCRLSVNEIGGCPDGFSPDTAIDGEAICLPN